MLLEIRSLSVHFGKAEAIKNLSMFVETAEILCLIGANGAGKTTLLRTVSGLKRKTAGEICFENRRIDNLPPYKIVGIGIAHCPEGKRLFHSMTVLDNLYLGAFLRKDKKDTVKDLNKVYVHFPILEKRAKQLAGSLSGGEQQMLAMGRGLMAKPKLLLLDEPSLGLSPIMIGEVSKIIRDINMMGVTIILVEQNAWMALKLSNRAYALELGRIVLKGKSSDLLEDDRTKKAYLGIR